MDKTAKTKIEHEILRIDKSIVSVKPLLDLCKIKDPDIIEITAVAQVLHSFYNGVESIIILLFKCVNEKLPNGLIWHKTLFEMSFGNNSRNVKIINDDIKNDLEKYLLFRHYIRHSYGSELDWNEMRPLVKEIENTWKVIKNNFEEFIKNN